MADTRPQISPEKVRGVLTTRWVGTSYRPVTVKNVESYYIESNMDQDSDAFSIVIGDPRNTLGSLMLRDSEIRVQIFGVGLDIAYLLTGLVDDVDFSEEGRYTLTGRDLSCIPADTAAESGRWLGQKADQFIEKRARGLKCATKFNLAGTTTHKIIKSDSSESEWEFWYRLIRNESQWLWFSSDGSLNSSKLNYDQAPSYYFGTPPKTVSAQETRLWQPVERVSMRKTTQGRVGWVQIFYHSNGRPQSITREDPTTKDWLKRPLKLIESKSISTVAKAKAAVYEEIYETKVGALELKVLVPDIGVIIRQNRMAQLNIPELDLGDKWFIVGSRIIADDTGYMQEVRLREKGYAISARKPEEPKTNTDPGTPQETADCLSLQVILKNHPEWMQFFVNAAHQWRSNVDFDLFLATLLGICDVESGFQNERNLGGPGVHGVEWFKWEGKPQSGITTRREWELSFGNEAKGGYVNIDLAVGPMQLLTPIDYKHEADQFDGGTISELEGNRWLPEANIWVGAHVLNRKGATRDENLWAAVGNYYGSNDPAANEQYSRGVQYKVYTNPGYLKMVKDAIKSCKDTGSFQDQAPDLAAAEAAQKLLNFEKAGLFSIDNSAVRADLEATVAGKQVKSQCSEGTYVWLSSKQLNAMIYLIESGMSCGCSCLTSNHDCNVNGGGRSRHSDGFAADIDKIGNGRRDFNSCGVPSANTRRLIMQAMKLLAGLTRDGGRPKQMIMGGNGTFDKTIQALQLYDYEINAGAYGEETLADHLNHIHIGY